MKQHRRMWNARNVLARLAAFLVLVLAVPATGFALSGNWDVNDHVETRIVAAVNAVGESDSVRLGLEFKMKPGWKIYWRSPGDAGFPPQPDWSGSENLEKATLSWPVPRRFSVFGLETLGYEDEVLLPLKVTLKQPGEPLLLAGKVRYLACKDICVPYEATLSVNLPAGAAASSAEAGLIDRYAAEVPGPDTGHGLALESAVLLNRGKEPVLQLALRSDTAFDAPDIFVEAPDNAVFGKPVVTFDRTRKQAVLEVKGVGATAKQLDGQPFVLTAVDGDRALERHLNIHLGNPLAVASPARAPAASLPLWRVLLLAVLGGLILNLMPCVLPVLSIKLLAAMGHGGGSSAAVRRGFMATAAGIIVSMLVIAAALTAVKLAGFAAGWGIQFQQPVFLAFMLVVVTLFAYNLIGLFEIILPQRLASFALAASEGPSLSGHFLTGAFATLLATPCSAPFVGTAIGFALSRTAGDIFAVFAALGIGLALPYLIVVAFPRMATALPRPGPWMIVLRRVLGVALAATAIWLLSVLAVQIGRENAVILGVIMGLIGAVLALRRLPGSRLGRHSGIAVLILAVAALALPVVREPDRAPVVQHAEGYWRPFDPAELKRIVAGGGTVFVDVTADWCITCQVNKKLVLDQGDVEKWLARDDVVAMRADWTRPDPMIAAYLASFDRYGIPFNAIYGPQAPNGIALPELLTRDAVLQTAARATGSTKSASQ